ncbi:MAG TPA: restriction endonuclease subunit S [Candidatus Accumulibacter phosphatis]|nr:MAG: Type I restriction enzyme EcoKI specificity protein [Candidatus Accumulibacter sp. SK-11]HRL74548.1 restriction endonuclease subunit S [Candidatus Accumulibacter phosphatis]HRQ93747.1 restriction endonuclease subunit S [Candidatus Accumulibacter phosphatis]
MSAESDRLLPRLPAGWITTPVRYATTCLDGKRVPLNVGERSSRQGDYPYWGANGIVDSVDEYLFDEPLVLLGEDGAPFFDKTKPVAFFVSERVWVNNHIHVLRVAPRFDARFVVHALNATDYGSWIEGSTRDKLTQDKMGSILLPTPPLRQQRAIADYLDHETARLDSLVAAKERVLGLLAEKRRALITRAVTRGLDPHAPLSDSGIPWLGEIPAHWETRRAAWLFRERDDRGEAHLPLLEVSINAGVVLREFSDERIESTAADFNTYKVARQGDVAFNKMRMWQGAVGVAPQDGLVSPDYVVAAPSGSLTPEYAGLLFRTSTFSAECARRSHGIVWDRLRLYWEGFRDIELPLPSADDQRDIVAHIAKETAKLDELRAATERTIALLKERRAALISATVTGRIQCLS